MTLTIINHTKLVICVDPITLCLGVMNLKKMTPNERYKFVHEKRLCNNCLLPGHYAAKCYRETTCSVPGCGKKHTKFLHFTPTSGVDAYKGGRQMDR